MNTIYLGCIRKRGIEHISNLIHRIKRAWPDYVGSHQRSVWIKGSDLGRRACEDALLKAVRRMYTVKGGELDVITRETEPGPFNRPA